MDESEGRAEPTCQYNCVHFSRHCWLLYIIGKMLWRRQHLAAFQHSSVVVQQLLQPYAIFLSGLSDVINAFSKRPIKRQKVARQTGFKGCRKVYLALGANLKMKALLACVSAFMEAYSDGAAQR